MNPHQMRAARKTLQRVAREQTVNLQPRTITTQGVIISKNSLRNKGSNGTFMADWRSEVSVREHIATRNLARGKTERVFLKKTDDVFVGRF